MQSNAQKVVPATRNISRTNSTETIFVEKIGCKRLWWVFSRPWCCKSNNWNEITFSNESKNNALFLYGQDFGGVDGQNVVSRNAKLDVLKVPLFDFNMTTEGDLGNGDEKGDENRMPDFKEIDGSLMQILRPGDKSVVEVANKAIVKMYVQLDNGNWVYGFKKKIQHYTILTVKDKHVGQAKALNVQLKI